VEKLAIRGVGVFVLIAFSLAFVTTFNFVNLSFLSFSSETFLLIRVSNLTQPDGLFNPLSYDNQVSEMLCRASNQIFKVRDLKGVGK
jgi:hypothetical protein